MCDHPNNASDASPFCLCAKKHTSPPHFAAFRARMMMHAAARSFAFTASTSLLTRAMAHRVASASTASASASSRRVVFVVARASSSSSSSWGRERAADLAKYSMEEDGEEDPLVHMGRTNKSALKRLGASRFQSILVLVLVVVVVVDTLKERKTDARTLYALHSLRSQGKEEPGEDALGTSEIPGELDGGAHR